MGSVRLGDATPCAIRPFIVLAHARSLHDHRSQRDPDLILLNGKFHTVDKQNPIAEAVAIGGGKFIEVGSAADVMRLKQATTQVIDLGGRTVIPGLNDSHLHLIRGGLNYNLELRWEGVPRWPMHCAC
jgi:predicted amidohydrolase YtcJ